MVSFYALALGDAGGYQREILSCTVFEHLSLAVSTAGGRLFRLADESAGDCTTFDDFWARVGEGQVLLVLAPAAGLSADAFKRLASQPEPACLMAGREVLAVFGQADALQKSDLSKLPGDLAQVQVSPAEGLIVSNAEST